MGARKRSSCSLGERFIVPALLSVTKLRERDDVCLGYSQATNEAKSRTNTLTHVGHKTFQVNNVIINPKTTWM